MGGSTAHGSDRTARLWSGCSGRAASESRGRCGSASLAMRRRERARGTAVHHSPFPGCSVVSAQLCESSTPSYPPICHIHQTSCSGIRMVEWSRITSHLEKQSFMWWHPRQEALSKHRKKPACHACRCHAGDTAMTDRNSSTLMFCMFAT